MKFLRDRIRVRRLVRAAALHEDIERINATLSHIDGESPRAEALRTTRATAWQKRNDLLTKTDNA